jgi:hypothetical protein
MPVEQEQVKCSPWGETEYTFMQRRTFLLGLIGGLAAAAGVASGGPTPAHALPSTARRDSDGGETDVTGEQLDGVAVEPAQYYRRRARRVYRRYYRRPARRVYRRARRRYWRRGRYYYY